MAKGRPADPTRRRRKTGNRPMPGDPKPIALVPQLELDDFKFEPPEDLHPDAQEIWRLAVSELAPRGLRPADLEAITMMATAAHRHRQASEEINKTGLLVQGQRGPMVNPLIKVERDMAATYLRIANDFGLTVAARLRLGLLQLAGQSILQGLNADLDLER